MLTLCAVARTGTTSLKRALEILGFGPCYHMSEVFHNSDEHPDFWLAQRERRERGLAVDEDAIREFLKHYDSGLDFPICSMYRELMAVYPEAKVILTMRNPESWYNSILSSIHPWTYDWSMRLLDMVSPSLRKFDQLSRTYFEKDPHLGSACISIP